MAHHMPGESEDRPGPASDSRDDTVTRFPHVVEAGTFDRNEQVLSKDSVREPLDAIGKHVEDSARRNHVPIAAIAAGSAAVLTWIALRRKR
ncbi:MULTISPECIES: hypothetical protein [Nocardia]|uniref:DUF3618 domain-containing protein n=1 Tax=Nocardia aurea TaxID=2144174 RepID=A0ABV3FN93_9NOCA|nr:MULTISPECIES: hypothetical protein [Nocardia]